jgi:hypothetical protein
LPPFSESSGRAEVNRGRGKNPLQPSGAVLSTKPCMIGMVISGLLA